MKLKALQKKWYRRLKSEGFHDIESSDSRREFLTDWHSTKFYKDFTPESARERFEYFNRAGQFLHEYRFKTRTEKQVWHSHAEGKSLRRIAGELKMTLAGSELSVHSIVRRLQRAMKGWQFEDE